MSAHSLISKDTSEVINIIEVDPIAINYCGPDDMGITPFIVPDNFILIEGSLPIGSIFNSTNTNVTSDVASIDDSIAMVQAAQEVIDAQIITQIPADNAVQNLTIQ